MTHGMVSAAQPEAVEAGIDILRAGGNVVDAAIGAALVQTAVDPQMSGIAGMGCLHLYLPSRGVHTTIDFHGRAPRATRTDMWQDLIVREADDGWGFILQGRVNEIGYQSITTPMTLRAFDSVLARFGTRSLGALLQPAIAYCEDGFLVRPHVSEFWHYPPRAGRAGNIGVVTRYPATRKIYTRSNAIPLWAAPIAALPAMARRIFTPARSPRESPTIWRSMAG
jgi:gamma-glutamyltranspeptidase/glutathione hydrolase